MPRTRPDSDATPAKAYARRRAIVRDLMADLTVAFRTHAKAHRARPGDWRYPNDLDEVCLRLIQLVDVLAPTARGTPTTKRPSRKP